MGIWDIIFGENISATERMLWRCAVENIKVSSNGGRIIAEINTVKQITELDFSEIWSCACGMSGRKIVKKMVRHVF